MSFEQLRAELDRRGFTAALVMLPHDERRPAAEGALQVVEVGSGFELRSVDYGRPRRIAIAADEPSMATVLWDFLDRPISPTLEMTLAELDVIEARLAPFYPPLRDQIRSREGGTSLIQLPPGVLVDRVGALDGWLLYQLNSSFESRSLPPTALSEPSTVHQFVTEATVLVQASVVPPWFGQPGGAVRYAIADESLTIRDLLVDGSLRRISVPVRARTL